MAYRIDLPKAARRHYKAAELLDQDNPRGRRDVAGYLYGIAAELALKQIMRKLGMRPRPESERRSDPFYKHFPELKTSLRNSAEGRHSSQLLRYANDPQLMEHWDVEMRYAPPQDIPDERVTRWAEQAKQIIQDMEKP